MAVVHVTVELDVGASPFEDAVSWFIHQYGSVTPELLGGEGNFLDAAAAVVLDVIATELVHHEAGPSWRLLGSRVEAA